MNPRLPLPVLLVLLSAVSASVKADELSLRLLPGIEQDRNYDEPGRRVLQWVRSLPPHQEPYLQVVSIPETWLDRPDEKTTPAEIAERNSEAVAVLQEALQSCGLLNPDPVTVAGRIVSLLRPVHTDGEELVPRYRRIWELWEVLADAGHADTFSASFSAVQVLRKLGITSRVAQYPSSRGLVFGVLLPGLTQARSFDWSHSVGNNTLLPVSLDAQPVESVTPDQLASWPWEKILTPGWSPGALQPASDDAEIAPPLRHQSVSPGLCLQADMLGLNCPGGGWRQSKNVILVLLAASVGFVFMVWGWTSYRDWRHRLLKLSEFRAEAQRRRF